jgi:hypothetical protein
MNKPARVVQEPLVVFLTEDRTGTTYALSNPSVRLVRSLQPGSNIPPRIFIAKELGGSTQGASDVSLPLLVGLLTGLPVDQIERLGVSLRDAVSEEEVRRWPTLPAR